MAVIAEVMGILVTATPRYPPPGDAAICRLAWLAHRTSVARR